MLCRSVQVVFNVVSVFFMFLYFFDLQKLKSKHLLIFRRFRALYTSFPTHFVFFSRSNIYFLRLFRRFALNFLCNYNEF